MNKEKLSVWEIGCGTIMALLGILSFYLFIQIITT